MKIHNQILFIVISVLWLVSNTQCTNQSGEINDLQDQLRNLQAQLKETQDGKTSAETMLSQSQAMIRNLKTTIESLSQNLQNSPTQEELDALRNQVADLENQLNAEKDAKTKAQSKVTELHDQVNELSQQVEELEKKIQDDKNSLENELSGAQDMINELKKTIESLKQNLQNSPSQEELDALQNQVADLETQLKEAQDAHKKAQSRISDLENTIESLKESQQNSLSEEEVASLQEQIANLEKQLNAEKNAKILAESKISDLENVVNELSQQLGSLEIDLEDPQYEISDFVWKAMNFWYFWQEDVPLLADIYSSDQAKYKTLIKDNKEPELFFENLQYKVDQPDGDRFSWFIQDYIEQEKSFQGISRDHGMQFRLARTQPSSNNLFGFVQVVHKQSNAEKQGVKRGMIFTHVDGTSLNISNYRSLLDNQTTFTINLATPQFEGDNFTGFELIGQDIELTEQDNFSRNPIVVNKIIEIGQHKIGYLFYNQFVSNPERHRELNDVFADFNSSAITDLVVDLRYNPGGFSGTSDFIAAAISGRDGSDVVGRSYWNNKVENTYPFLADPDYFPSEIGDGTPINKLDLDRVFFITSMRTASASEGLINNLKPYMDVVVVGEKTLGKNEGSFTLYDKMNASPSQYVGRNSGTVNPRHKNAIQPVVVRSGNSDGFYEFQDGIPPDRILRESPFSLGTLGDKTERLLKAVLDIIIPQSMRVYAPSKFEVDFELFERPEDKIGIWTFDHILQEIQSQ